MSDYSWQDLKVGDWAVRVIKEGEFPGAYMGKVVSSDNKQIRLANATNAVCTTEGPLGREQEWFRPATTQEIVLLRLTGKYTQSEEDNT